MRGAPVYLHHMAMVSALGDEHQTISRRVGSGYEDCLTNTSDYSAGHCLPLGLVKTPLPCLEHFEFCHRSRCNQLLMAAMEQIRDAFMDMSRSINPLRIGVVLGTSTSGIAEGEQAIKEHRQTGCLPGSFDYLQQEMSSPVEFLSDWLDIRGPSYVISTACTSSAKALASARRLLDQRICDLVIAGGVDSLCQLTVNGFAALESVSKHPCQPFSVNRDGINIGEGAALFLMSRERGPISLCGVGESSDAYHISAPDPEGKGAARAMKLALEDAELPVQAIGYVNLHGTATQQNDKMESLAVARVLGSQVACSSTKPYTGHTLGAAGAIEAALCWLTLQGDKIMGGKGAALPAHLWDAQSDPELEEINLVAPETELSDLNYIMSNSFAFGGSNVSLVFGRDG